MKDLLAKSSYDETIVTDRMMRTFKARRSTILEGTAVDDLLTVYPALREPKQVCILWCK
jgi:hypothetical protein